METIDLQDSCIVKKDRDYFFDNMKAVLVFSVVIAHYYRVGTLFRVDTFAGAVYIASFSFIMQGFLFASGFFSKNVVKCRNTAFRSLLFPYLLLMPLMYFVRCLIFESATLDLFTPTMALWFLLTLFYYRFSIAWLVKIKWLLPISVVVSLLSGCVPFLDERLSLARTFGFLPFFILGYYCRKEHLDKLRNLPRKSGIAVLALLILTTVLLAVYHPWGLSNWYMKYSYGVAGLSNFEGIAVRIFLSVLALLWIFVFLNLLPSQKCFLTSIGQNTMPVYVFHIIIRYLIKGMEQFHANNWPTYLALGLLAAASVWILSRTPVVKAYNLFTDGIFVLLTKPLQRFFLQKKG